MAQPRTTSQKIWDNHVVRSEAGKPDLLYIDLHLVHEVTSPQAFEGLRLAGRKVRRPELTLATVDHNVPTIDRDMPIADPALRAAGRDAAQQLPRVRRAAATTSTTCARASSTSSARSSGSRSPA